MIKDFYGHIDETLEFTVQLLDEGLPIDMTQNRIQFAIAPELDRPTIATYTLNPGDAANEIEVLNANLAIVQVSFTPTANAGFRANTHSYQMRTVDVESSKATVALEGKVVLLSSLFD